MNSRSLARAILVPALTLIALDAQAQTTFVAEQPVSSTPLDLALSTDGELAVVRGNDPANSGWSAAKVTVWRTSTGAQVTVLNSIGVIGQGNLMQTVASANNPSVNAFSDGVAASANRAVSIGSADTNADQIEDTTYIDVLQISTNPANNLRLNTIVVPDSLDIRVRGGLAHDVAITPMGIYAVVNSRNWIHVITLQTGQVAAAFNIGSDSNGACDPGEGCNSIALDDNRAVVTVRRLQQASPFKFRTWAYVVDLTGSPTLAPGILLDPAPSHAEDEPPHDVDITPDGTLAVVTSSLVVGLLDLQAVPPALLDTRFDSNAWRGRQPYVAAGPIYGASRARTSILLTNSRVVVGSLERLVSSGFSSYYWKVDNYLISQTAPHFTSVSTHRSTGGDIVITSPLTRRKPTDPYLDMTLSRSGTRLALKSFFYNAMLTDLTSASGPEHQFEHLASVGESSAAQSVLVGLRYPVPVPLGQPAVWHEYAAFLGRTSGTNPWSEVAFYDLDSTAADLDYTPFQIRDTVTPSNWTLPADLALTGGGYQVVARFSAPPDEVDPAAGGRDWYRFSLRPLGMVGSGIGGKGVFSGTDSLQIKGTRSVSISEKQDPPGVADGYVHFVLLQ